MTRLTENSLAQFILISEYQSYHTHHVDHYFCGSVNLWRDFFRPHHLQQLVGMSAGERCSLVQQETITYDPLWRIDVNAWQWRPPGQAEEQPVPRVGRWYPQGFLVGVDNIYPQNRQPMRILAVDEQRIIADCNHPLANEVVSIDLQVVSVSSHERERGGRCTDWLEDAFADGPGMQLVRESERPDYDEPDGFSRLAAEDDRSFYDTPRLVNHIDSQARAHLLSCMEKIVAEGDRVLDLMSSINSHLPPAAIVTGLGMNMAEMEANELLRERVVHDLNREPKLPFGDSRFDLVCCHLSFEYLIAPVEIVQEIARVLRPGGCVVISFANRWFPEKVTKLWTKLHEFERMGYVVDCLREHFDDFSTTSFRNWPRPVNDPHYFELHLSDPLYVVSGYKQ
jgi:hypothetical protein